MSIGRWLADNLIPWALAGVAFLGSYSHLVALGQTHGVHGALAYERRGASTPSSPWRRGSVSATGALGAGTGASCRGR